MAAIAALLLAAATTTTFVAAQSNAESIQLVIPRGPVQQGANVSLGFSDGSASLGNNNEGAFSATKVCVYAPDGSEESDCANAGYVSFSSELHPPGLLQPLSAKAERFKPDNEPIDFFPSLLTPSRNDSVASLSINNATGEWELPTQRTCVVSSQISGSATYSFGFNTGNWTSGNSTAVFERIIIYGSNGTNAEPNPSTPSNGLTCIYPPFTRRALMIIRIAAGIVSPGQIIQANGTVQVIDPPANGQPQVVQTTTSSASFATTEPRSNTGGAGRIIASSSMAAGLLGLALVYLV